MHTRGATPARCRWTECLCAHGSARSTARRSRTGSRSTSAKQRGACGSPPRCVVDDTQVDQVFHQWQTNGVSEWKVPLLQRIIEGAEFSGKISIPWAPDSLHEFMHAKLVVADDTTFVGSFNFSRSGEMNAENVLEIRDAAIADRLAVYVDELRRRYPRATPPGAPATSTGPGVPGPVGTST